MSPQQTLTGPRIPKNVTRRLEVAAASAWEALVRTHVQHALNLIGLMEEHFGYEEAIERYLEEMNVTGAMAAAVRNRSLVHLEGVAPENLNVREEAAANGQPERRAWPMRQLGSVMRGLRERLLGNREVDEALSLAFARAEEGVMKTHISFAVAFAETLREILPTDRAVQEYVGAVDLTGCRAQAVSHRAMAQIADSELPDLDGDGIPGYIPGAG